MSEPARFTVDVAQAMPADLLTPNVYLPGITVAGGAAQPWRIALWAEKASAAPMLERLARAVEGEAIAATGEASDAAVFALLKRAANDPRRALAVLVLSDFDPAGHRMPISIARKAQAMIAQRPDFADLHVEVRRVGMTKAQCEAWSLLETPLKPTDPQAKRWLAHHGRAQTELDAALIVAPDRLEVAIRDAIAAFRDHTLDQRTKAAKAPWLEVALEWSNGIAWLRRAQVAMAGRRNDAQAAADDLRARLEAITVEAATIDAKRDKLRRLMRRIDRQMANALEAALEDGTLPSLPMLPDPAFTDGPPRIFDSREDFVTSTRRMQADRLPKGLRGEEIDGAAELE